MMGWFCGGARYRGPLWASATSGHGCHNDKIALCHCYGNSGCWGSLWRQYFIVVCLFVLYCCLRKERGNLSSLNTVDGEIMGDLGPDTNRPRYLLCLLQSSLERLRGRWERGRQGSHSPSIQGKQSRGQLEKGRLCIKGCP